MAYSSVHQKVSALMFVILEFLHVKSRGNCKNAYFLWLVNKKPAGAGSSLLYLIDR